MTLDHLRPYLQVLRRHRVVATSLAAAMALVLISLWYLASNSGTREAGDTVTLASGTTISYGEPTIVAETTNIPGSFRVVWNEGKADLEYTITETFPVERSSTVSCVPQNPSCVFRPTAEPGIIRGDCSAERIDCVLTVTTQVGIVSRITDVSECTEAEMTSIGKKLNRSFQIAEGRHGLEEYGCARLLDVRDYPTAMW